MPRLTWQSEASNDENTSFTSDDPFAVLADDSGTDFASFDLDISVGRFPVKSVSEARTAVDKLIKYVTTPNNGSWKNNVLDVADDENQAIHMKQSEETTAISKVNGGNDYIYNKVYIDAFNAVSQGSGRTYPDARAVCLTDWATFCAGVKTTTEKPLPQATRTTICAISSLATLPCAQLLLR